MHSCPNFNISPASDCSVSTSRTDDCRVTNPMNQRTWMSCGSLPDTARLAPFGAVRTSVARYSQPVPTASPTTESREYEARHLLALEGLEAVRKRAAMYIGSNE